MRRLLEMEQPWTLQDFFSGWFRGAPHESIRRGNVLEFTAYGFYAAKFDDLPTDVSWVLSTCSVEVQGSAGVVPLQASSNLRSLLNGGINAGRAYALKQPLSASRLSWSPCSLL